MKPKYFFNRTVQTVSVFYCEAVKPADKRNIQETNKRLIKMTQDDETDRKR